MRGKAVFKYVVVLKRNDNELVGAAITTFDGATELPLNKVGKKEHWYPVAPAIGHYEGLPQTDGTPAWVCINNAHTVTGPDPVSCFRSCRGLGLIYPFLQIPTLTGNTYSQEAIDLIIAKLKEFGGDI